MTRRVLITLVMAISLSTIHKVAQAQNGLDPLLFSTQALNFSTTDSPVSPLGSLVPSVAKANGFSTFLDNPAAVALIEEGFFSFGYNNVNNNSQATFFGVPSSVDRDQGLLTDLGFLYKAPTEQGSLVFGLGYNQQNAINRSARFTGFNNVSTITDQFRLDGRQSIAFDVFATDFADTTGSLIESIFRIGFNPGEFPGISQTVDINQSGYLGEFSGFIGTEFQQNLYVGVSLGITTGRYSFERTFIESDAAGNYNDAFIDADEDGTPETDINRLTFRDDNTTIIRGTTLRVGTLYTFDRKINIGASYQFKSRLNIEEDFFTSAESDFDNGAGLVSDDSGIFEYDIIRPARLSLGLAIEDIAGLSVSGAVDLIDYSETEVDFSASEGSIEDELFINNQEIAPNFEDVFNFRVGAEYQASENLVVRGGYAYLPSRTRQFTVDRTVYGAGASFKLTDTITFDVSAQYSTFDDRSILYTYQDFSDQFVDEILDENIEVINLLAGIRIAL